MINIQVIHQYDCEVLITGGGPAGSCLAYHLAEQGIQAIVLESKKFPRDKTCGDAVSAVAISELERLGITKLKAFKNFNEINQVALFVEGEKIDVSLADSDKPKGRVIPRFLLDNWIYEAAKEKGVEYIENTKLIDYSTGQDYVLVKAQGSDRSIRYFKTKVLVGADGSNSTVARILQGGKPADDFKLLGLRAYYEGISGPSDRCDIFFSKSNFPGLFWFFPIGTDQANIGSAMIASTVPKNQSHAKHLLQKQITDDPNFAERIGQGKIRGKITGWPLKFKDPSSKVVGQGVILIGDAAGLINPLSGDGIQYALLSARWAAEHLAECSKDNDFSDVVLQKFKYKLDQETAYDIALSSLLVQITRNRSLTTLWMEVLQVLFDRARDDEEYAAIIAGIFDGSYPSYKALDPTFLIKSLLQGVIYIADSSTSFMAKGPESWIKNTNNLGQEGVRILQDIRNQPIDHISWLLEIAKNTMTVGKHAIKHSRNRI